MNDKYYSNIEFSELINKINNEMNRRSTYRWWDPFSTPSVGQDRTPPLSIPVNGSSEPIIVQVTKETYTVNNPSIGSIEPTRNIRYPAHGDIPAGLRPTSVYQGDAPNTSAAELNADELRNMLVGLSKIQDINLFYGRDEIPYLAFRDPTGIENVVNDAASSILNALLHESDIAATKNDPNGGIMDRKHPDYPQIQPVTYPTENGKYVMPSGEYDGEEIKKNMGLGPNNFYDDYGAEPGNSNFHPINKHISEQVRRDWHDQDNQRNDIHTFIVEGGKPSSRFGPNPRNPQMGDQYASKPVYGGKQGSCQGQCSGLCYTTCDNECSESCTVTCWNRCGNGCSSSCGNSCTSCSGQCMTSCKTKCENITGYSCLKAGAKTVKIMTTGGTNGIPAQNTISYTLHTCSGCSYSCQFYPNKKTECWDSGCMGECFISCSSACSSSCFGGCIDNAASGIGGYKSGKGRGCSAGCTLNCIGDCSGVCSGFCISTCFGSCKTSCNDNCTWTCMTECGDGCRTGCTNGCTGCTETCAGGCRDKASSNACTGCSSVGGCKTECMTDCSKSCMGKGCRSICGVESAGACSSNCRLSCMATSCTAMCSNACSDQCTTCVNNCGNQCGACSSLCSTGCESACNIVCSQNCANSCDDNCVHSCSEECGACSSLCFSCTGLCIGVCSVKCENGCSSCANQCSFWCDTSCNRACMGNCSTYCITGCVGSCATRLTSDTHNTSGPDRPPTSDGYQYPNPKNRWEERESFKLVQDIPGYTHPQIDYGNMITIATIPNKYYVIIEVDSNEYAERIQRVLNIDNNGIIQLSMTNVDFDNIHSIWKCAGTEYFQVHPSNVYPGEFVYLWDVNAFGRFSADKVTNIDDKNIIVTSDPNVKYMIFQASSAGGVWSVDANGNIILNDEALSNIIEPISLTSRGNMFIVKFLYPTYENHDIKTILPYGFNVVLKATDAQHNLIIIIKRDETIYPTET